MPRWAFTPDDEQHMRRALALAARGQGSVEPNPMVGCVIVRGNRVVGEGYHRRFGGPHAEVHALRGAGRLAKGATAYVTLEPCCHFGKTPPCTQALIAAGISRVIVATPDPFPKVAGRGLRQLKAAGLEVAVGLGEADAVELNQPYLKLQRQGRPWVILKWAQSIDGKIATRSGDSQWISGERSRALAHRIRGRVDAVIVGVGTALADDPLLTCRHGRPRRTATRIVIDPQLRLPLRSRLVRTARTVPTMVVANQRSACGPAARRLARAGVEVLGVPATRSRLDLGCLLDELGRRRMTNVMVEGGGQTLGRFYDAGLADEAIIFVAPRLIGGATATAPLAGLGPATMKDLHRPGRTTITRAGDDLIYTLRLGPARRGAAHMAKV
ncbi:MAG TPA: bifunctional diaminohydroxyphosphoribosylaminopyrimidine deaminase/5-amino-6-(5-phosphoribosylamino)uracil reductase RibD [Phycisphaerae bacterium]|nr:bifunctional diaminohydroxyphosphoribosylaminopyrimidine deaminase/5-amino-6-(5-phosphoribosylamino)uracil reductase RibD [Phycisphaerae bacterium]HRY69158.1 bifunctional diaminohydroxyphosphoribosylaminopyrimidine deaminase/5-amino-6-(5-phosphoribosylamino)uracil reductase RibD [Phycisphaerae bacterium]HSA26119.1 bifunctional diaminohydroxyphosphoribosylaminopyrimidine deaminase/5-amino-6-(5-phosphoribosylamino)uracil reductase RibD [Phycisphaerae bacterium]